MVDVARGIQREVEERQMQLPFPPDADAFRGVEASIEPESLFPELATAPRDAFPGSIVPIVAATAQGLQVANLAWGYRVSWNGGPVFNTRMETATSSERNMWADSLQHRRCLVATPAFYETSETETATNPRTGRQVRQQYRFTLPNEPLVFLAGVYKDSCFSIMTCTPNRWVSPVHPRMPIALHPNEASTWLSADYPRLFDRTSLELEVTPA